MELSRTLNFLKATRLALVTCADGKILGNFLNCISAEPSFSHKDITVINDFSPTIHVKEASLKLAEIMQKETFKNLFVPLKCDTYSEMRSIYFYLPESVKYAVQIFVLKETETGFKLACEFGENAGRYILYDYDALTGKFTEEEN